jgi:hypothetical protein
MRLFTICASSHGSGSCIPPGSGAEELPLPAAAEGLGLVMSFLPVSLSVSSSRSVPARAAAAHPIRYRHFALVPGHQCRAGRLHAWSCTRAGTGANGTGRADIVAGSRLLVQQLLAVRHPSPIREKGPRRARRNRSNLQPARAREQKSGPARTRQPQGRSQGTALARCASPFSLPFTCCKRFRPVSMARTNLAHEHSGKNRAHEHSNNSCVDGKAVFLSISIFVRHGSTMADSFTQLTAPASLLGGARRSSSSRCRSELAPAFHTQCVCLRGPARALQAFGAGPKTD